VRRIDRHTIVGILRGQGAALVAEGDIARSAARDSRLDVPSVEESLDSAANRTILALVNALRVRSKDLRTRLQMEVTTERHSDTRTSLASRWSRRRQFLDSLVVQLEQIERSYPFTDVQRAEVTAAGLTAITADPAYARAWNKGWHALRRGVDASETTDRLWLPPSWEIYERWCFMRLGQLLKEKFFEWNWSRHTNPHRWIGFSGSRRAELTLQPTFCTSEIEVPHRWSVSKQREPDVVLAVRNGNATKFVVFDVKYRVSRQNVLDAMTSAHIYQDSLRIGARRPEATFLIVPRSNGAAWLTAPGFLDAHRVGVYALDAEGSATLPHVVAALLT
jgi:hypothetical protein